MILLVKLLAIAIIVYGCILILRPRTLKRVIEWAKEGNNIYISSGAKIVMGILLMLAAPNCTTPWIILFFGALSVFGSVVFFLIKRETAFKMVEWFEARPVRYVFYVGLVAILMGALLILAA